MSRHSTPASASARRIATAPMSIAVMSLKRPNGCSPTPMMATSSLLMRSSLHRCECERHDFVAGVVGVERYEHELHRHPDLEHRGIRLGEPGLDLHFAGQLDVADRERDEVLARRARVR